MATFPLVIPPANIGRPYQECFALRGNPKTLIQAFLPEGFTAELVGSSVCIKSASVLSFVSADVVLVIAGSCSTCDPATFTGVITTVQAGVVCACAPMTPLTQPINPLNLLVGDVVDIVVPLNGSGPFEFCADFQMPKCLSAKIIGDAVFISGVAEEAGRIAFAVKNACTCDCQEWSQRLSVTPVVDPCVTSWLLSSTIFIRGVAKNQSYTATGIPAGCSLTLGAFIGNIPWPSAGSQSIVTLTPASPTFTYPQTWDAASIGQDFNFQPINLPPCMTCIVQPQRIDFDVYDVPAPPPCDITFNVSNQTITAAGQTRVITVTGPPGATVALKIVGVSNGIPVNVTTPYTLPGPFPFTTGPSLVGEVTNVTFSLAATGASSGLTVCGGPFTVGINVPPADSAVCTTTTTITATTC